jgi:glycine oxidase
VNADVVIVGGGIVGLSVARRVARAGARVQVVDRGEPTRQASWAAAGMLAPQAEAARSGPFFSLMLRARRAYPTLVAELEAETGIDVGYRSEGMIFTAFSDTEVAELEERFRWQSGAGLEVERLSAADARRLEPALSEAVRFALRFPGDHQVENRALSNALGDSARRAGADIQTGRNVRSIRVARDGVALDVDGSTISAPRVVIAAGSWSGSIEGQPRFLPVEPVHGELLAITTDPPIFRHVIASAEGYLVPRSDGRLIVGTTVARVGFRDHPTVAGLERMTKRALTIAPELAACRVASHWSGLRPGTPDGLPVLGPDPEFPHLLYATGHYRNGILLGPLTGEIVGALALGEYATDDLTAFRPDRF